MPSKRKPLHAAVKSKRLPVAARSSSGHSADIGSGDERGLPKSFSLNDNIRNLGN